MSFDDYNLAIEQGLVVEAHDNETIEVKMRERDQLIGY